MQKKNTSKLKDKNSKKPKIKTKQENNVIKVKNITPKNKN